MWEKTKINKKRPELTHLKKSRPPIIVMIQRSLTIGGSIITVATAGLQFY